MARLGGRSKRFVRKALWLASWPDELRARARAAPDVFPSRVLFNVFAGRMNHYEEDGWRRLRAEIARMETAGPGARPRKPYASRSVRAGAAAQDEATSMEEVGSASARERLFAEARLRMALMTLVKVNGDWVKIRFHGAQDLDRIVTLVIEGSEG
jgi:hypothetical protein